MEELRAEQSIAFIAVEIGIPQHASYIAERLKPLKDDKREIFRAAADAQRILDMVLGFHPDLRARHEAKPEKPDATPAAPDVASPQLP
jgi:antirestriction protein ArdC